MLARLLSCTALIAALASSAGATDAPAPPPQHLTYDLSVAGQPVGTRELTIRYLPRDDGERRVVEAYTDVTVAGQHLVCRTSGQSSPRGANFTSSVDQAGAISQVQGIELPTGGWRIILEDATGVHESTLPPTQARLTSLDLLDPGRTPLLGTPGAIGLVLVETGEVLAGTLDAGTAGTIKVGGKKVAITRYGVAGSAGSAHFDIDADGLLLGSELRWMGASVSAIARAVPPPRSFGSIDGIDSSGVNEDSL